ncbi:MAG: hypothetical protein KatS3mg031_0664 [Chitinophagales bacterium]|nr:MAG: hypothetical protein KatS3mg031_0664 [Chitinophagales bacterium]
MRILKLLTLVGLISTIYPGNAQNSKQANIWYFGMQAGLDFNPGNPVALTNGAMEANEGVAVISDRAGNLLFYTNGGDMPNVGAIWNRNHQIMPNGALVNQPGCASSIQSSLILKKPGSTNVYYLFTTDCYENAFEGGLSYSIIDMNLDGGLGDVVVSGVKLTGKTNESLTAVAHANGRDYWIITHKVNTDSFYVFQLTANGITGVVKSKVGPVINETAGEMKASRNGQRLVYCGNQSPTGLYDFDAETGIISNYRFLNVSGFTASFSPNCEYLYVAEFLSRRIYQFSMIPRDINLTRVLVATASAYIGSLQLGPDDKIYVALRNSQYLGTITRPNIKGTNCNFVEQGVYLGGKISKYGLPNFANDVLGECVSYPVENVSSYDVQFASRKPNPREIILYWDTRTGASAYRIGYRKAGNEVWNYVTVSAAQAVLSDLEPGAEYEVKMDAILYPNAMFEPVFNHIYENVVHGNKSPEYNTRITASSDFGFEVFPNPMSGKGHISLGSVTDQPVEAILSDLNGKTVIYKKWENGVSGTLELPVNNLSNGVYQLSLRTSEGSAHKKIMVVN